MPAGFCGLNSIRAGSCKKFGGQLGKVPNNLRQQTNQIQLEHTIRKLMFVEALILKVQFLPVLLKNGNEGASNALVL